MFEIQNLHVNISEVDKKIIDGIYLKINPGQITYFQYPQHSLYLQLLVQLLLNH